MSIFAKLDGITTQGRVADQGHAGGEWIAIDYWNWGTRRKITSASSTRFDRESTTVQITDLWIGRRMDSATQSIVLAACCGTGVTATLRLTKTGTGSGADVFAEYVFRNSLISQYKTSGTYLDIRRPVEHICLSFIDFEFKYIPYDDDNRALSPLIVGFNTATNMKH